MKRLHSTTAKRRRVSAAALVVGAMAMMVWGASPALAATSFSMSPSDTTYTTGGAVTLSASASADGLKVIQAFQVVLTSTDATPAYSVTVTRGNCYTTTDAISINWTTNGAQPQGGQISAACEANGALPATSVANGTYKLTSTVWTCTGTPLTGCPLSTPTATAGPSRTFKVSIAPKTPAGVKARLDSSPVVSWNANPEPDITGYRIFRTDVNKQVGNVVVSGSSKPTSWADPCSETAPCTPGTAMTYKVAAVRKSPVDGAGVASAWSGASEAVTLPIPPSPAPGESPAASPSAAAQGGSNPLNIPATAPSPLPGVTAPTKQIIGKPPISDKYAPTLPYAAPLPQDGEAPVEAPSPTVEAARIEQQVAVESAADQRPPKLQFIAGALVLVVAAMHLARGGGILLRGSGKASQDGGRKGRASTS